MSVEPFVFETTYNPNQVRDAILERTKSVTGSRQDKMLIASGLVGFALLLSWYTFALGAVVLAISTFGFAMKHRARSAAGRLCAIEPGPITLRVTEAGYAMSTPHSSQTGTWESVRGFNESGGYLTLRAWHAGGMFLSIDELRAAGVYDRVKALAEAQRAAFAAAMRPAT